MTPPVRVDPQDRLDLRALVDAYALAVDARDVEGFVSLFAPEGELVVFEPGEPEPVVTFRGPEQLATVLELVSAYSATFHLMANHTCSVDGAGGEGQTYCLAHHLTEAAGQKPENTLMVLRYVDTYEHSDGAWRFARRAVMRQWTEQHAAERGRLAV